MSFPPPPPPPPPPPGQSFPPPNGGQQHTLQHGMHNMHVSQQNSAQGQQYQQPPQQSAPYGFQAPPPRPPAPPAPSMQQQRFQPPPPPTPAANNNFGPGPPHSAPAPVMQQQHQYQQQQQYRPGPPPSPVPPSYPPQQFNAPPAPPSSAPQQYAMQQQPPPPPPTPQLQYRPPPPATPGQKYPPQPPPPPGPPGPPAPPSYTGYPGPGPGHNNAAPPPPYPPSNYGPQGGHPVPPPQQQYPGQPQQQYPGQPQQQYPGQQQQQYPPQNKQSYQQQSQPKIDPSQIPRPPLFIRPNDNGPLPIYSTKAAAAQTRIAPPPPADSRYLVHDDGNASPQLIRSNMYTVPSDRGTWQKMGEVDMGLLCSPMALPSQDFVPTLGPQIDSGGQDDTSNGTMEVTLNPQRIPVIEGNPVVGRDGKTSFVPPPRCRKCSAYVNPYWGMDNNKCNFCGVGNHNTNFDLLTLQKGTVDYAVDGPYVTRKSPVQPIYLYAVDLTSSHLEDYVDMLEQVGVDLANHFQKQPAQQQLQNRWREQEENSNHNAGVDTSHNVPLLQQQRPRMGICFVASFGIVVLARNGTKGMPHASIMADVMIDPFCHLPLQEWTFDVSTPEGVDEWTKFIQEDLQEGEILKLLKSQACKKNAHGLDGLELSCGGAALQFCADALAESGGRVTWISTRRPNFGAGAIRHRAHSAKSRSPPSVEDGTPLQEITKASNPEDASAGVFYKKLQENCSKNRVVIDIIIHSNPEYACHQSLELATQGEICRATCGKLSWLSVPGMGWKEPMMEELRRPVHCFQGWDAVFKVRCSLGMQVKGFVSHPGMIMDGSGLATSPELELSCVTPQTNICVLLEHMIGGIPKKANFVFVQSALLYTTLSGQRRVRVSTLALRPSTNIPDIFLSIDFAAFTTVVLRRAVARLRQLSKSHSAKEEPTSLQRQVKDDITNPLVKVLLSYRQHTTAINSPRGQLILPEKLQLLPLFAMCLLKSPMLRPSIQRRAGPAVVMSPTYDERAYYTFQASAVGPASAFLLVHPNVFSIGKPLAEGAGEWRTPPGSESAHAELSRVSYHSHIELPDTVNASMTSLEENGVYLIDTGLTIYLFFGKEVQQEVKEELYHLPISMSLSATAHTVTDYGRIIRRLVWQLRSFCSVDSTGSRSELRPSFPPVFPVSQGDRSFDQAVMECMVDDPNSGEKDYTDFLCKLHKMIRDKFEGVKK